MDKLPYGTPPRWWDPQLSPFWIRVIRTPRKIWARATTGLRGADVHGLEYVRAAVDQDQGVVIIPKHAGHADAFTFLLATDRLNFPFHYLVGWQVFQLLGPAGRKILQWHGCFSINRETNDFRAFRQAVDIVQNSRHPLVIFAEGEVFHHEGWVAPLRPGTAAIAQAAARKARRPIVCIPAAIRYRYLDDPTPQLEWLMDSLERKLRLVPWPALPLAQRVYRFAEALLARRERFYLGEAQSGPFPQRVGNLVEVILRGMEARQGAAPPGTDVPGRVTHLRQHLIPRLESVPRGDPRRRADEADMAQCELVIQLFSYTHDYEMAEPTLEHLGEILDKFEEDVLGAPTAGVRGAKWATLVFGPPIPVPRPQGKKEDPRLLTEVLQRKVQEMVDDLNGVSSPQPRRLSWR